MAPYGFIDIFYFGMESNQFWPEKTDVCRISTKECGNEIHPIWICWEHHDWTKYGTLILLLFLARTRRRCASTESPDFARILMERKTIFITIITFCCVFSWRNDGIREQYQPILIFRMESWWVRDVNDFRKLTTLFIPRSIYACVAFYVRSRQWCRDAWVATNTSMSSPFCTV